MCFSLIKEVTFRLLMYSMSKEIIKDAVLKCFDIKITLYGDHDEAFF